MYLRSFYTSTPINTLSSNQIWRRKHSSTRSHYTFHVQKPTKIKAPLPPPSLEQPFSLNDRKNWTRWSFATNGSGQLTQRTEHFVRMRSLDECRVAVRSRKVDFLSGNARYYVVELMRVARYCVYVSTSLKFSTFILVRFWSSFFLIRLHKHFVSQKNNRKRTEMKWRR